MLPTGELLVRAPDADRGRTFRCRVVNTVTGQTRLSSNAAKVVLRGELDTRLGWAQFDT